MTVNDLVQWTSSDSSVAEMISSGAQVQGRAQGGTILEAFEPTSKSSDTIIVTVLPPVLRSIMVFPAGETIPNGQKLQFTATGFFSDNNSRDLTRLRWSSSKPGVEINQKGEATAKTAGKVTITAEDPATRVTGTVDLTVR